MNMSKIETNIYQITNLEELNFRYRIYQVKGISPDSEDYEKNVQILVDGLSRRKDAQSPVLPLYKDGETFLVQPEEYPELPSKFQAVGSIVKTELLPELKELDLENLDENTGKIAIRFLQFALQRPIYNNPNLWQPQTGFPFYLKTPDIYFRTLSKDIDLYRGFNFRIVYFGDGKLGVCVDTSSKYVSRHYLPTKLTRDEFKAKYEGHKCLYEYGNRWYEVKLKGFNDLNTSEVQVLPEKKSLYEKVHEQAGSKKSQALLSLPKDCCTLFYYNSRNEPRNMPSGLCRLTYGTNHDDIKPFHSQTIKHPEKRRKEIQIIVDNYLRGLSFGNTKIKLSRHPFSIDEKKIFIPDLEFGNGKVLSVRRTPGTIHTDLNSFGYKKKELVYSSDAGLYVKKRFYRQYMILPRSIYDTFGEKFISDMKYETNRLFQNDPEIEYSPIIIDYDDSVQKNIYQLAKQILTAIDINNAKPGFGLLMIPKISSRLQSKEDELGNLLLRKFHEKDIFVSIIHTTTSLDSYEDVSCNGEESKWDLVQDKKQRGKFKGYLKNVVLNKILLLNSQWPFVLKTPLNADLTIGIDVKNHTAGFTLIYKDTSLIRFENSESNQKEHLSKKQMKSKLIDIIRDEDIPTSGNIRDIVIHRDGKLFQSEIEGIKSALESLAKEGKIHHNPQCTFIEIRKTSRVSFRCFKIVSPHGLQEEKIYNPFVGTYIPITEKEHFICNTGYPFKHRGTSKPLHVIKVAGDMPIIKIIEDIFYLSNLTWTKLDDCSRYPLTLKMTDIRLREYAGEYDKDALEFVD